MQKALNSFRTFLVLPLEGL